MAISRILKLKNKINMKNLIKYGFIAVVSSFWSCGSCNSPKKRKSEYTNYSIIEMDGCEYYVRHRYEKGYLSHKGNCKNPIHKCNCK